MGKTGVFGHLAIEVLAVDRLQATTEEALELDAEPGELTLLPVDSPEDDVLGRELAGAAEAFRNPVEGSRTRDDEIGPQ